MQTITPFLWFDNNLEEALAFYTSIFKDSEILNQSRSGPDGPLFMATFRLNGQTLMGLNGGPMYKFTEALSMFVSVETQDEVDHLWDSLSAGGELQQCGWLKDKFGLSWQIVPTALGELMGDPDPARSQRVMQAILKMVKIDIQALRDAHAGG
ncbi:MAG TPA: VOC family protein [Thermoflexales bacterium]|nr:VOC family protein [Thermoflexales bacterium]HQY23864.1 VOC family protein [Thermoflexales bacterium]